jgi:protein-tyrosine phosphatase
MTDHRRVRICFVCSGNICRSPITEVVMRSRVERAGLADLIEVDSGGTGDWHIGERVDRRALHVLAAHGYDGTTHRARQFEPSWFEDFDLVVALDAGHARTLRGWAANADQRAKVHLLRSFDPAVPRDAHPGDLDVPDPYYEGPDAFEQVLRQIEAACDGLLGAVPVMPAGRFAPGPLGGHPFSTR